MKYVLVFLPPWKAGTIESKEFDTVMQLDEFIVAEQLCKTDYIVVRGVIVRLGDEVVTRTRV